MPDVPFPYPGNKSRLSNWIVQYIPEHTCFVSVFGGAAGILFNKPRSKVEVYNDRDTDLVHFFRVMREREEELVEWLSRFPFSRKLHGEWADKFYDDKTSFEDHIKNYCEEHNSDEDIVRAGIFFFLRYGQWGSKYGNNSGFAFSKVTNDAESFANARDRLNKFADRFDKVVIECLDWKDCMDNYDGEDTVFYLDPPYYKDTSDQHYQVTGFNHRNFVRYLATTDAKWILSYAKMPPGLEDYYIESKESNFMIGNGKSGEAKQTTEHLIMNFDPDKTGSFHSSSQQALTSKSKTDSQVNKKEIEFLSEVNDEPEEGQPVKDEIDEFEEFDKAFSDSEFNIEEDNKDKKKKDTEKSKQDNKANKFDGIASNLTSDNEQNDEDDNWEGFLEDIEA